MYTEGFEGLEEAEKESRRTYGAAPDMDRLLRENDKLKKSLEKEKFFNKLLDQEIQELKSSFPNGQGPSPSDYWSGGKRVSKGAFYTLFLITLVMAAYIGYGIYYDKKFDYLNLSNNIPGTKIVEPTPVVPATASTIIPVNSNEQPKTTEKTPEVASAPPAVVKDSVPNIIGSKKAVTPAKQKAAVLITPDEEYDEAEVEAVIKEKTPAKTPVATTTAPPAAVPTAAPATVPAAAPADDSRPVIGRYRITSKANFYNSPDENTMRSTFISESANKTIGALEDKNGFIFVVYTNDLGFTSKGWLSKKDLTKE